MLSSDSRSEVTDKMHSLKDNGSKLILMLDKKGVKSLFEVKEDENEDEDSEVADFDENYL